MDIKEEAINDIENFINSLDEKRANISHTGLNNTQVFKKRFSICLLKY